MEAIALVLSPLIWLMRTALDALAGVVGYGWAIVLVAVIVRVVVTPVTRLGAVAEKSHSAKLASLQPAIAEIRATSKGRERFERIDALYTENNYHPIHSMVSILPLMLQIPFLLSALILLVSHPSLHGQSFLFIHELTAPDQLVPLVSGYRANLLPVTLTGVAIFESFIRRGSTTGSRLKFLAISTLIAILIYPLPAAVCLYWLVSNVWSLGSELLSWRKSGALAAPNTHA